MKKNKLFISILVCILTLIVLSWIIPTSQATGTGMVTGELKRIGLFELINYPVIAISAFADKIVLLLAIGCLYGILSQTGKYRQSLTKVAKAFKGKEVVFLIVSSLLLTVWTSFIGNEIITFLFIPLLISVIMLMGYDKITALLTTIGSVFVGLIGSTYSATVNGILLQGVGTPFTKNMIFKITLLVLSYIILMVITILRGNKTKKAITKAEEKIPLIGSKTQSKKHAFPIYIILGVLLVLVALGCTPWNELFGIDVFSKFHESLMKINILKYIIGGYNELGRWQLLEVTSLIVLSTLLIILIYRLSFDEVKEGLKDGFKAMAKPVSLFIFAHIVLLIAAWHPFTLTITDAILKISSKFNIFVTSFVTFLNSLLNIEFQFLMPSTISVINGMFDATKAVETTNLIVQSIYGLSQFLVPTSTLLIVGLSYLNVPYKDWFKENWKLFLGLFIIIFGVILTFSLI